MARKRGEISVFLSLILVCVLSLLLGLVESARTAGARLYLEMAANSAMASVMSQYNRNLWDMYHLLFLETESDQAVTQSFTAYLGFYLEQGNLYPMEIKDVNVEGKKKMADEGGMALEQEILSYVTYRLPDVATDLAGITEAAKDASKVGDFRELLEVCRSTGQRTRRLETCRYEIEKCLRDLNEARDGLEEAVSKENEQNLKKWAMRFEESASEFESLAETYKEETQNMSKELMEMKGRTDSPLEDEIAKENLNQEILAYEQVIEEADRQLKRYEEAKVMLEASEDFVEEAAQTLEEAEEEVETESRPNWDVISEYIDLITVPEETANVIVDQEKVRALDRLENVLQGDLLNLVLEENVEVSRKSVRLNGIPSERYVKHDQTRDKGEALGVLEQFMINEYCFLSFDSFHEHCERTLAPNGQPLQYEQEYLLCGESSDRENLKETVEKLLAIRGALNLLYLLQSPDCRAEADALSMAVSGGFAPVQFILSFFVLAAWAFGEAVWDMKLLMKGGSVSFFKSPNEWKLDLDELLGLQFLEEPESVKKEGNTYQDYMRVLFFLMDSTERNYRIMDITQWNVQTLQEDFLVEDCLSEVDIRATVKERHLFMAKNEYSRSVEVTGAY